MKLLAHNRDLVCRWMTTRHQAIENQTAVEVSREWNFARRPRLGDLP